MKNPANTLDAVNKAYADCIKYNTTTGIIPNIAMTGHTLFTFPAAKTFASEKIIICEMWVELLADEWIVISSSMFATSWPGFHKFPESIPYDILQWFPASGWTNNFRLDYIEP